MVQLAEAMSSGQPVLSLTESDEDGEGQIDVPVPAPDEKISDFLALKQIISQLDDTEKKLIELRYFKNLTQSRTADILGESPVAAVCRVINLQINTVAGGVEVCTCHINGHLLSLCHTEQRSDELILRVLSAVAQEVYVVFRRIVALCYLP